MMKIKRIKSKSNIITIYIKSTGHNTFFSLFENGVIIFNNNIKPSFKLLKTYSCGSVGFKNKKKETPFAINVLVNKGILYALINNYKYTHIIFKGSTILKKIIINNIIHTKYNDNSLRILSVTDITNYPYNGCRLKKIKKR